ncbi:MAG: hypothetical protein R3356_03335, partial [Eudoraea sp.]|nr:hypothetical protein [Eudoraea sp.]
DDKQMCFSHEQFVHLIRFLNKSSVDAIEISYGTMDYALNIFRGDLPVSLVMNHNKVFKTRNPFLSGFRKKVVIPFIRKRLLPFSPMYNLEYAILAKQYTNKPVISVGGFRSGREIEHAIREQEIDFVSLCRPFLREPDFATRLREDPLYTSKCTNCNYCAVMCDSEYETKCYKKNRDGNN